MILEGKRAVVTGGGRGIGAAVARTLAGAGAAVVVAARTGKEIDAVATELTQGGTKAWAVRCDVTDPESVSALAAAASEKMGGVDLLINNAGIARSAPLKAVTLEEWETIFAVNVRGVFLCTQTMLPGMLAGGWGRVVNIASVAGLGGAAYITAYCASKHAVIGFTRALALEVASRGVTINAVCPGYVDTPMTDGSVAHIVAKTAKGEDEARQLLRRVNPQGRLFTAEEVAHQVLNLCDPRSAGVNGHAVVIDGGAMLQ